MGIEDVRIQVAELEQLADARDLQRQRSGMPVTQQVVLRQLGLSEEVLAASEPETDLERTGELLLHRDFEQHLVVGGAALLVDLDAVEEAERGDAGLRGAHAGAAVEIAFGDAHLPADHLVARLVVADDLDLLDGDRLALLEHVGEIDQPLLGIDGRVRCDVRVCVALVLVDVEQPVHVVLQASLGETLAAPGGDEGEQLFPGYQQVSGDVDLADVERLAFVDGHGDEDVALVRRQLDRGLAELHVDVALIEIQALEHDLVALECFLAIRPCAGEEGERPSLLREHGVLQLGVAEGAVADEADLLHRDLRMLVDLEDHVHFVVGKRDGLRRDLREEESLLDVLLLHLLRGLAHCFLVEDLERLHLDGVLEVVLRELLVALQLHFADRGLLADHHREHVPGEGGLCGADVDLDVVEITHPPHRQQRALHLFLVVGVSDLQRQRGADRVRLHAPVALHAHLGNLAALRHRRRRLRSRLARGHRRRLSDFLVRRRRSRRPRLARRRTFLLAGRRPLPRRGTLRGRRPRRALLCAGRRCCECQGGEKIDHPHGTKARTLAEFLWCDNEKGQGFGQRNTRNKRPRITSSRSTLAPPRSATRCERRLSGTTRLITSGARRTSYPYRAHALAASDA